MIGEGRAHAVVERDPGPSTRSLGHAPCPCTIDEDAAHHLRRDAEELTAVLPRRAALVDEFQVRLVHERRRLQRVIPPFPAHVGARAPPQISIDERQKLLECSLVAAGPRVQQLGDVFRQVGGILTACADRVKG